MQQANYRTHSIQTTLLSIQLHVFPTLTRDTISSIHSLSRFSIDLHDQNQHTEQAPRGYLGSSLAHMKQEPLVANSAIPNNLSQAIVSVENKAGERTAEPLCGAGGQGRTHLTFILTHHHLPPNHPPTTFPLVHTCVFISSSHQSLLIFLFQNGSR